MVSQPPQNTEKVVGNLVLSNFEEDNEKIQPVVWNGKKVRFDRDGNVLKIEKINGGELAPADLRKHDYISRVYAIPFKISGTGREALGVAVRFRPTSHRGMFLVYDPDGRLVYQELLECFGMKELLLEGQGMSGQEYLYLGVDPPKVYQVI